LASRLLWEEEPPPLDLVPAPLVVVVSAVAVPGLVNLPPWGLAVGPPPLLALGRWACQHPPLVVVVLVEEALVRWQETPPPLALDRWPRRLQDSVAGVVVDSDPSRRRPPPLPLRRLEWPHPLEPPVGSGANKLLIWMRGEQSLCSMPLLIVRTRRLSRTIPTRVPVDKQIVLYPTQLYGARST